MKNIHTLLVCSIVIILFSCSKEINCIKNYKDARFIDEYMVVQDSCNKYQNNFFERYFLNDTIVMEGYGDRVIKQGAWTYYNKGEKVTSGEFKNSSPIGSWSYKGLKKIEWEPYQNNKGKYHIDVPNDWIINDEYINLISIVNDTVIENFTTKVDIQIGTIDVSFNDWANSVKDEIRIDKNISNVKFKELNLFDIPNSLEMEYTEHFDGFGIFRVNQINIEFNNKVYMIITMIKKDSNYSYEIIREQIMRSFKFVNFEDNVPN